MSRRDHPGRGGFTLIETVLASAMTTVVMASAWGLFLTYQAAHHDLGARVDATRMASMALSRMVYGVGSTNIGLRAAKNVVRTTNADGWELAVEDGAGRAAGVFSYVASESNLCYAPPGGTGAVGFARSIAAASAKIQTNQVVLSVRVDLRRGRFSASQQLDTAVRFRNWKGGT